MPTFRRQRGLGLVDALLGLLVLTLGLLAVLRLQPQLRQHAEVARQRSEAVRLAQREIEQQRAAAPALTAGERSVDDPLASTRYRVLREIDAGAWPNATALAVTVQWADRDGNPQQLRLATIIATLDAALAGAAVLPR